MISPDLSWLAPTPLSALFYLLGGHALADYVWQSPEMAYRKHPCPGLFNGPDAVEKEAYGPWWWWMSAHSLINGLIVGYVLNSWVLGVAESVTHFLLDTLKCLHRLSTTQDQVGHLISKGVWVWLRFR